MSDNLNMKEYENETNLMASFPYLVGSNAKPNHLNHSEWSNRLYTEHWTVSGHTGLSLVCLNIWFWHFCLIRIVVQCPSNILARLELVYSIWTHGPESNQFKCPIPTFSLGQNIWMVSWHIGPSLIDSIIQVRHFCLIRIVVQCPDTWAQVWSF